MTMRKAEDGKWYGTIEVLLIREVDDEYRPMTQTIVGTRAPFGPIYVTEFEGKRHLEEWDAFWIERGFSITEPPILAEARRFSREKSSE